MAKIKVTARFAILELIDRFIDNATANDIGRTVVTEAKRMIAEGQSPVRGYGRFERYKDRTKYPGKLKDARPVNLYLSGDMLKAFGHRISGKDAIEVGMVKGSELQNDKATGHHTGDGYPVQRRFIPGEGEEFAVSIMRAIRDIYGKRLASLIRKSNKKD